MSDQDNRQASTLQCPTTNDPEAWKAYWKAQDQSWRTEPEIDAARQKYLAERRAIVPDIEQGIYPFKDFKLSRADVEWLLATHENGRGPVDWNDESQRKRKGLDLRGANLCGGNLHYLPLSRLGAGLTMEESIVKFGDQHDYEEKLQQGRRAAIILDDANLFATHLEGADLFMAHMERINLRGAYLENTHLSMAQMKGAFLNGARLKYASLGGAHLEESGFFMASLEDANLSGAYLEDANFFGANLKGSRMIKAELMGTDFRRTRLDGAELDNVRLGNKRHIGPRLADIRWGDINLTVVNWTSITMLGDEDVARQKSRSNNEKVKSIETHFTEYDEAVRANRQLAAVLRNQGLNEEADKFAYRGQRLKCNVLWQLVRLPQVSLDQRARAVGAGIFSIFLDLLAGYGYRPGRSVIWYLVTIFGFALAYFAIGHLPFWPDAIVYSLTSFHGRGFLPSLDGQIVTLHYPLVVIAAFEAVVGLLIEISFIATFTQRFFGR